MISPFKLSVVLADGNRVLVEALSAVLGTNPMLEVDASTVDGHDAIMFTRAFQPRILVVSASVPGPPVSLIAHMVHQYAPTTRIIITTTQESLLHNFEQEPAVWGTASMQEGLPSLIAQIEQVGTLKRRPRLPSTPPSASRSPAVPHSSGLLSRREIEVLELVSDGITNAEIAFELRISAGTVKRHLANLYGKLGVNSRVSAIRTGVSLGLLHIHAPPTQGMRI